MWRGRPMGDGLHRRGMRCGCGWHRINSCKQGKNSLGLNIYLIPHRNEWLIRTLSEPQDVAVDIQRYSLSVPIYNWREQENISGGYYLKGEPRNSKILSIFEHVVRNSSAIKSNYQFAKRWEGESDFQT